MLDALGEELANHPDGMQAECKNAGESPKAHHSDEDDPHDQFGN